MSELDALLKQFEQPKKPPSKENPVQQTKLPLPSVSNLSKFDSTLNDSRKTTIPNPSFSFPSEQRRPSILKSNKASTEQSIDFDSIFQNTVTQPQQPSKGVFSLAPAKNSTSAHRRDSLIDLLSNDRIASNKIPQLPNTFSGKVSTVTTGKQPLNLNSDDFFADSTNRDTSATKQNSLMTKTSAKQYYIGNSRYKPGKINY